MSTDSRSRGPFMRLRESTGGRLGGHTLIYGIPGALAGMVGLITAPLYTHAFTTAQYGTISIIASITALVASLSVLGLDAAAARYFYDEDPEVRKRTLSTWILFNVAVTSAATAVLVVLAKPLTGALTGDSQLYPLFLLSALALPFGVLRLGAQNFLRFQNRAVAAASFAILAIILGAALPLFCVFALNMSLRGVFVGQLFAATLLACVGLIIMRRRLSPAMFSRSLLRRLLGYGLPLVPASIAVWVTSSSDRIILGHLAGADSVGIYSLAVSAASAVGILVTAFRMAWPPLIFSRLGTADVDDSVAVALRWGFWAACVAAAAFSVAGKLIVQLLAPPSYESAYAAIPFIAFSSALEIAFIIFGTGAGIEKTTVPTATAVTVGAVMNVPLNFLLIPLIGFVGAALATFLSWLIAVTMMYRASQRLHHFSYQLRDFFAPLIVGMATALLVVWMTSRGLALYWNFAALLPIVMLPLAGTAIAPVKNLVRRRNV